MTGLPARAAIDHASYAPDGERIAFTNTTDRGLELWVVDVATASARRVHESLNGVFRGSPFAWLGDGGSIVARTVPAGSRYGSGAAERAGRAHRAGDARRGLPCAHLPGSAHQQPRLGPLRALRDGAAHRDRPERVDDERRRAGRHRARGAVTRRRTRARRDARAALLLPRSLLPLSHPGRGLGHGRHARARGWRGCRSRRTSPSAATRCGADAATSAGAPTRTGRSTGSRPGTAATRAPRHAIATRSSPGPPPSTRSPASSCRSATASPTSTGRRTTWPWSRSGGGATGAAGCGGCARRCRTARPRTSSTTPTRIATTLPGDPLTKDADGHVLVTDADGHVFLTGEGASPEGNRPFLDRLDLATGETTRLFRSEAPFFETPLAWVDQEAGTFLTRRESRDEPPNYYVRGAGLGPPDGADVVRASLSGPRGRRTGAHSLRSRGRRPAHGDPLHAAGLRRWRRTPPTPRLGLPPRVQERRRRRAGSGLAAPLLAHSLGLATLLAHPGVRGARGRDDADRR